MASGYLPARGRNAAGVIGTRARPTAKVAPIPAPAGGINAVDPLATLGAEFCVSDINMIPDGRGMRVRSGYRAFATSVGTGGIRTVIPFTGSVPANDRLYTAASNGIFDVSAGGAGPWTADVTFPTVSPVSGYGIWTNFVADSGVYYALYTDEENGLFRRQEGGSWAAVTDITGVAETDLVFCTLHKTRLWFVERNTASAWYLASGAIAGPATEFNFGNKFQYGGTLVGLYTWSMDGGDGVDDYFVALGSGGDVIVYRGSDPSSTATWEHVGTYYLGALPVGRRIAATNGGDLYVLSQYGVIPLSRLVSGRPVQEQATFASRNISPLIVEDTAVARTQRGWELRNIPSENILALVTPKQPGFPYKQYGLSSQTNGWCVLNDLPYLTGDTYNGTFYFGNDTDTTLYRLTGSSDNVAADGTGGVSINWNLLTTFSEYGEPGRYHRVQFIRPVFTSTGVPSYAIQARYDYNQNPVTGVASPSLLSTSLWDAAAWDAGLWGGLTTAESVVAGTGIGRAMAVGIRGSSSSPTLLIRFDIIFDSAGPL